MKPKYLVVAMWEGKVRNHCGATDPASAVTHFETACRALLDRYPTDEEKKNGLAKDDEVTVQVLCLDFCGVLVEEK
jgi:hypothetical protein